MNKQRLQGCPNSPNCVSSQAIRTSQRILPLSFHGNIQETTKQLRLLVQKLPFTTIIADQPTYMLVEFRSRWFRFIDDVEFLLDVDAQLIHVRSASRRGYYDLGVNRRRIEAIRSKWLQCVS